MTGKHKQLAAKIIGVIEKTIADAVAVELAAVKTRKPAKGCRYFGDAKARREIAKTRRNVEGKIKARKVAGKRGPKAGTSIEPKPCPECGVKNKARRFRYYCPDHRDITIAVRKLSKAEWKKIKPHMELVKR